MTDTVIQTCALRPVAALWHHAVNWPQAALADKAMKVAFP